MSAATATAELHPTAGSTAHTNLCMGGPHSSRALRQRPASEGKLKIYKKEIVGVRTLILFIFVALPQPLRRGARGELKLPRCPREKRCSDRRLDGFDEDRREGISEPKLIRIGIHVARARVPIF
jgi:hypothetical protein